MVLVRQASEQKKVALMVLSSHCLDLGKASGPLEAIEVGQSQLMMHFLHAI